MSCRSVTRDAVKGTTGTTTEPEASVSQQEIAQVVRLLEGQGFRVQVVRTWPLKIVLTIPQDSRP
jgi:hypothetical protein